MNERLSPKLRTVEKYQPLYPLNTFTQDFAMKLGRSLIAFLAARGSDRLEGSDWEEMFAKCVGARWTPSNVGLDDITLAQMAWGAKTVKNRTPFTAQTVRLISGRNSLAYSFGEMDIPKDPNEVGKKILSIWNERVKSVRAKFAHLRTVVLLKGVGLREVSVFETDTRLYDPNDYDWQWNEKNNLEGLEKASCFHKFTWQPSGSQFTIIEKIPQKRLSIRIKPPEAIDEDVILKAVRFNDSWITIVSI